MSQKIIFGLAALVIASLSGWLGWRWMHPADKACTKSIALCKPPNPEKAMHDCIDVMADVHHRLGGAIERMAGHCMVEAETCNESLACLSHADRVANGMKSK